MKTVACVLVVVAAGCASAPAVVRSSPQRCSLPSAALADDVVAAAPTSAASAAVASLAASPPMSQSLLPRDRWAAAGGDDASKEIVVTAPRGGVDSPLREDRLVGDNAQPEWTTERRWPTTRAYVLAPGQIEFEQWLKLHAPLGEGPDKLWQTEVAFGLPHRFQVDLYENFGDDLAPNRPVRHEAAQFEVRYALADWGVIPFNPTLYEELKVNHRAADALESKLLFADDLAPGVHWAVNLFDEQTMGDARTTELGAAGGISWSVLDSKFSAGAEAKYEHVSENGDPHNPSNELLVGPSIQWRPTPNSHLDIAPLMGLTKGDRRDPRFEIWIVFGWDFGPERKEARPPTSTGAR